jgi:hypothetical protein
MPDHIVKIESFPVHPRWLFVRVETAQGAVGWGEATLDGTEAIGWVESPQQIDALVERVGLVRATGMDVGVDFHGRVHKRRARCCERLNP